MHIAIDLQSCQSGSRLGGIGRYSLELAKAMLRRRSNHRFSLLLSSTVSEGASQVRAAFADLIPPDQIRTFIVPKRVQEHGNPPGMAKAAELIREQFLAELAPDCVHISSLFEGYHEGFLASVGQIYTAERTAVTLYDLIPLAQRERYLQDKRASDHYMSKVDFLTRAGLLLAISDFSRHEASELLSIDPAKVVNISSAADGRFKPIELSAQKQAELKRRYHVEDKFLMYTGSFDIRKNHAALIRAFGLIPASARAGYQLLIVGNGWDGIYAELRNVAKQAGLQERELVFAGHVADADLVPLYSACSLFVFPSLAEGFGLPVLEAMTCGTPTLCSNTTSLPEVMGLKEAMFDPTDPQSIAGRILPALVDGDFRDTLRAHGLERAKRFSWDESARIALTAMEAKFEPGVRRSHRTPSFAARPDLDTLLDRMHAIPRVSQLPEAAFQDFARCLTANHLDLKAAASIDAGAKSAVRTGWVTTWNTRCGIAAYSKFLLGSWPANTTVFAPHAEWLTQADEPNVVRCWNQGHGDDLEALARAVQGANLELVVLQFNYGFFALAPFGRLINRLVDLGIRVAVTFHSTHDPFPDVRLGDIAASLQRCTALVVHTHKDTLTLAKLGCVANVVLLPQGVIEATQALLPHPGPGRTIATYGFALPNKGLMEVLLAFSQLRHQVTTPLRLMMLNAEYPDTSSAAVLADLAHMVEELGLQDVVELRSEYLEDQQSLALLQEADVIVNAYQHSGESSSAAIRIALASGRPVAVTPVSIFDDVKSCTFALPGTGVEQIAAGLLDVLDQVTNGSALAQQIESNATRWRAAHRVARVSKALFLSTARFLTEVEDYDVLIDFDLSPGGDTVDYAGGDPALKTVVGAVQGQMLVSTSRSGHLLHGPYISVAPGHYRARLAGRLWGSGHATMDVCARQGSLVLTQAPLTPTDEVSMLANIGFLVPQGGVRDLEVRIEVDANVSLELSRLQLEPVINDSAT